MVYRTKQNDAVECTNCGWDGTRTETNNGQCPACDCDCVDTQDIYGSATPSTERR